MSRSQDNLLQALRGLAAEAPRGAPPELGIKLLSAFERHHARRRRNRMALVAGLATSLVISFAWVKERSSHFDFEASHHPQAPQPSGPARPVELAHDSGVAIAEKTPQVQAGRAERAKQTNKGRHPVRQEMLPELASGDFVALPIFNPAIPIGQSRVVRMEMPGSALQLIGYPVDEQLLDRRVTTDLLVGQDGVPYAIRFVQTRSSQ